MNKAEAYNLLADRLEQWRALGYDALLELVNQPPITELLQLDGEPIDVDVSVIWHEKERRTLCIWATAHGPSSWTMQRLDEEMIVGPGQDA